MSKPRKPGQDFASGWMEAQRAFWQRWGQLPLQDDAYARAEAFWEEACQHWWTQVGSVLPPPLDAQAQAALQQTRLTLSLARGMAREGDGSVPDPSRLRPDQVLAASLAAWTQLACGLHPESGMDADRRRLLAAHTAVATALSKMMAVALERARERLCSGPAVDPDVCFDITCQEVEREYRACAGSDAFARLVGELVNARIRVLPALSGSDTGSQPA